METIKGNPNSGWEWFEPGEDNAEPDDNEIRDLRMSFARCFGTRAGQAVLAHLRAITQYRFYGPEASDAALRHLEGQRHLVAYIHGFAQRERGDHEQTPE